MLKLVVDNKEGGGEDKVDEPGEQQGDEVGEQQGLQSSITQAIEQSARSADLANDRGISLPSRRTSIMSGTVYREIQRVYNEVLSGRVTTFRQVAAILKLQRILFPEPEDEEKPKDDIINVSLRELRALVREVEEGIPAELSEIYRVLVNIDYAPADTSTLSYLDSIEAEHHDSPFFEQLKRRIRAIRLIKKNELIHEYRARFHRIMNGEISQKTPDEIHKFQNEFFGDDTTPGCGLTINDLNPSPEERMLLNRLGGKGRGLHPVRDISMPS